MTDAHLPILKGEHSMNYQNTSWFFKRCENFTHWLQINYDRDNFWIARKISRWEHYLGTILLIVLQSIEKGFDQLSFIFMAIAVSVFSKIYYSNINKSITSLEIETYKNVSKSLRNTSELILKKPSQY